MSQKPTLPHLNVEVTRYRKPDGFATRYWAVLVNSELLVVTLYRKGAEAVAHLIANPIMTKSKYSPKDQPEGASAKVGPIPPDRVTVSQLEPDAARSKRRRKGLRPEILGKAPF